MNNKTLIVAKNTFLKNIKKPMTVILLILPIIAVGIILGISQFTSSFSSSTSPSKDLIAIVSSNAQLNQKIAQIKDDSFQYKITSNKNAEKMLKKNKAIAIVNLELKNNIINGSLKLDNDPEIALETKKAIINDLNNVQKQINFAQENITPQIAQKLEQKPIIQEKKATEEYLQPIRGSVAYAMCIILFFIIYLYSYLLAFEVAEEKGEKIMEVIISSIKAENYFSGKLLGIAGIFIVQIIIILFCLIPGIIFGKNLNLFNFVGHLNWQDIFNGNFILIIPITIISILLYNILAAMLGALSSSSQNAYKAVTPLIYLMFIGYIGGMILSVNGIDSLPLKIGSFIPFISSFFLPIRIGLNSATLLEISLSSGIMIITTIIVYLSAAKIYKNNVLLYDEKNIWVTLRKLLPKKLAKI